MRKSLQLLNDIQIASPCTADWRMMKGDDRVRFCDECSKNVYNLSVLTADAAAQVLADHGYSLCVRLYRRTDGTVLTADCPVGLAARARRRVKILAALAASWLGLSWLHFGSWLDEQYNPGRRLMGVMPPGTLMTGDVAPPGNYMAGSICPPATPEEDGGSNTLPPPSSGDDR